MFGAYCFLLPEVFPRTFLKAEISLEDTNILWDSGDNTVEEMFEGV